MYTSNDFHFLTSYAAFQLNFFISISLTVAATIFKCQK